MSPMLSHFGHLGAISVGDLDARRVKTAGTANYFGDVAADCSQRILPRFFRGARVSISKALRDRSIVR